MKTPSNKRLESSLFNEYALAAAVTLLAALAYALGDAAVWLPITVAVLAFYIAARLVIRRRFETLQGHREQMRAGRPGQNRAVKAVRAKALNALPSPILVVAQDHRIAFANSAAKALLGADVVGSDAFLHLRQPNLVASLESALEGEADRLDGVQYHTTSGRAFDVTIARVPGANKGDAPQVMVFFYEVTSLLRTEQMRVDFIANASHELRTPLASIMGCIETLQGPAADDTEAQARFLDIMGRESTRMTRLIDDLLSLSRIEAARHVDPQSRVDVAQLIQHTIRAVEAIRSERGITMTADVAPDLPPAVGDADQIAQVMTNLAMNAAKYATENTRVTLRARLGESGRQIHLSVRDEGPGIAPEHLARLTERFYRVDAARSRKMGGTGLGLAIVKHILLRHDSQLDMRSEPGKGSVFSFKLKVAPNARGERSERAGAKAEQKSGADANRAATETKPPQ
ncbi:ATP-binding protein [Yunchengibacter salinarum]|uniref:ATP-binding protein n=1 Tax=Yunchengibacter salinarum TaxID=3133399 RepID=UPI0035B58EC0